MTTGSKEFHEMRNQFEKDMRKLGPSIRLDRESAELNRLGRFYQNGEANAMFKAYMMGYQSGRCVYM